MHQIDIGKRRVLFTACLLVPEGDEVTLKFKDDDGDEQTIKLELTSSPESDATKEKPKPSLRIDEKDDIPVVHFLDWTRSLGSSTRKPIVFATSSDVELSLLANVSKHGTLYRVEFQVMSEAIK